MLKYFFNKNIHDKGEKMETEFVPRRIARWVNSPEAIVKCYQKKSIHRCVEKVLDALEILRLLDYFDVLRYVEILKKEKIYGESEKVWYSFLEELEARYPVKIDFVDTDP